MRGNECGAVRALRNVDTRLHPAPLFSFPFLNRSTRITRRDESRSSMGNIGRSRMRYDYDVIAQARPVSALVAVRNNLLDGSASRRADSSMARLRLVPVMSPHRAVLHRRVSNTQNDATHAHALTSERASERASGLAGRANGRDRQRK